MALINVNGQDVLEMSLSMPRLGRWTCDLLVDDPAQLAGQATISVNDGALLLAGTVTRSGVFADTGHVRVVAGAGALGFNAKPRHYNGTSVGIVLGDLLTDAGETLSPTADQHVLSIGLDAWTTAAVPAKTAITLLLSSAAPGAAWRSLPNGTVWVGAEMWRDADVDPSSYVVVEDGAQAGSMLILPDAPTLVPGVVFEGRAVSRVDHTVSMNGGPIETRVWFEQAPDLATDRLKDAIARLVRSATPGIDYRARYWARVVSQQGATIDVQPETAGLGDMAGVPLLLGLPGAAVNKVTGGRVLIGWAGADPSKPYAEAFDADTSLTGGPGELVIAGGVAGAARAGDATKLTLSPADVAALVASIVAMNVFTPSGSPPGTATPVVFQGGEISGGSAVVKIG
jgi:hypothetical protein